jgi:hypothetical protein
MPAPRNVGRWGARTSYGQATGIGGGYKIVGRYPGHVLAKDPDHSLPRDRAKTPDPRCLDISARPGDIGNIPKLQVTFRMNPPPG